jgi:hypothetical protein
MHISQIDLLLLHALPITVKWILAVRGERNEI